MDDYSAWRQLFQLTSLSVFSNQLSFHSEKAHRHACTPSAHHTHTHARAASTHMHTHAHTHTHTHTHTHCLGVGRPQPGLYH